MYTLYYLNRNLQMNSLKVKSLDFPVLIPEDLIFCNVRRDTEFIKEPHKCIDFTDIERLIISSEFTDMSLLKDADFRMQNTYLTPLCQIDPSIMTVVGATETRAFVNNIQESVMNRIYSCSGDVGVTMHIISTDGIERTYNHLSYLNFKFDNGDYYIDVIEPFEIVKIWFSDDFGDYANSNVFTIS